MSWASKTKRDSVSYGVSSRIKVMRGYQWSTSVSTWIFSRETFSNIVFGICTSSELVGSEIVLLRVSSSI